MGNLAYLYHPQMTTDAILPLVLKLCRDGVSIVRTTAALQVAFLVKRLLTLHQRYGSYEPLDILVKQIDDFATSETFSQRQLFICMSYGMLDVVNQEWFEKQIIPHINNLADDRVPNVRLMLAHFIRKKLIPHRYFGQNITVEGIVKRLSGDSVKDIQLCLSSPNGTRGHVEELIDELQESLQEVSSYEKQALEQNLDDMKDFEEQMSKGVTPFTPPRSPSPPLSPLPISSSSSSSSSSLVSMLGDSSPFSGGAGIPSSMDLEPHPGTPRQSLTSLSLPPDVQSETAFFF
jgi:hypothetical protein